mmetsp:Transcript_35600/g.111375  ORF Transcript_35600/g.111375 Transcript_35600/m.111375 type:complete len:228 (-) Transcript_35600:137-820(-)
MVGADDNGLIEEGGGGRGRRLVGRKPFDFTCVSRKQASNAISLHGCHEILVSSFLLNLFRRSRDAAGGDIWSSHAGNDIEQGVSPRGRRLSCLGCCCLTLLLLSSLARCLGSTPLLPLVSSLSPALLHPRLLQQLLVTSHRLRRHLEGTLKRFIPHLIFSRVGGVHLPSLQLSTLGDDLLPRLVRFGHQVVLHDRLPGLAVLQLQSLMPGLTSPRRLLRPSCLGSPA